MYLNLSMTPILKNFDVWESSDQDILFFRTLDFADVDLVRQPGQIRRSQQIMFMVII